MSKRRTGRKLAMQILFQADVQGVSVDDITPEFIDMSKFLQETKEWSKSLAKGAYDHKYKLDDLIKKYAIGWEITRINPIDRNILRLALYELRYLDTHPNIVINEALEIAKKYNTEDSPKFINGILGNYVKDNP